VAAAAAPHTDAAAAVFSSADGAAARRHQGWPEYLPSQTASKPWIELSCCNQYDGAAPGSTAHNSPVREISSKLSPDCDLSCQCSHVAMHCSPTIATGTATRTVVAPEPGFCCSAAGTAAWAAVRSSISPTMQASALRCAQAGLLDPVLAQAYVPLRGLQHQQVSRICIHGSITYCTIQNLSSRIHHTAASCPGAVHSS